MSTTPNSHFMAGSGTANTGPRATVLFVDDEERILNTMRILFRRTYDVLTANGGEQALELLKKHDIKVIVSDQRMPGLSGFEVLREARNLRPTAMRVLLTGYSDLNAILGSINEGEVFRFVNKPWSNEHLTSIMAQAVEASAHSAAEAEAITPQEAAKASTKPMAVKPLAERLGVLVLDDDAAIMEELSKGLEAEYQLFHATSLEAGLDLLAQHKIGVLISETHVGGKEVTAVLGALKQQFPQVVSIVLTGRQDADTAIALINQGQIFRFLIKPPRATMCQLAVRAAQHRHGMLVKNPTLSKRYEVEVVPTSTARAAVASSLASRIQAIRNRFAVAQGRQ